MKKYPVLSPDYELLKQYGESCIYPSKSEKKGFVRGEFIYDRINRVASEILELCNGQNLVEDIIEKLSKKYSNDKHEIYTMVKNFLDDAEVREYIIYSENKSNHCRQNIYGNYNCIYPIFVTFEITKRCPLKCKHCFNNSGEIRSKELESDDIISILYKIKSMGVKKIMLTGGEPLTKKNFTKILKTASNLFEGVVVGTNGFLINDEFINKIEKFKNNIVFQISIDGLREKHDDIRGVTGSFDRAINAIKLLDNSNKLVVISNTVNELNIDDTYEVARLVKSLGAKQITISSTLSVGRAKQNTLMTNDISDEFNEMLKLVSKDFSDDQFYVSLGEEDSYAAKSSSNCGHGDTQICIRENGEVSPCIHFPISYGNLNTENPEKIFHYSRTQGFRFYDLTLNRCEECQECIGCPAYAIQQEINICDWKKVNKGYLSFIKRYNKITI